MAKGEADIAAVRCGGLAFASKLQGNKEHNMHKEGDGSTYYAEVTSKKTGKTANAQRS